MQLFRETVAAFLLQHSWKRSRILEVLETSDGVQSLHHHQVSGEREKRRSPLKLLGVNSPRRVCFLHPPYFVLWRGHIIVQQGGGVCWLSHVHLNWEWLCVGGGQMDCFRGTRGFLFVRNWNFEEPFPPPVCPGVQILMFHRVLLSGICWSCFPSFTFSSEVFFLWSNLGLIKMLILALISRDYLILISNDLPHRHFLPSSSVSSGLGGATRRWWGFSEREMISEFLSAAQEVLQHQRSCRKLWWKPSSSFLCAPTRLAERNVRRTPPP